MEFGYLVPTTGLYCKLEENDSNLILIIINNTSGIEYKLLFSELKNIGGIFENVNNKTKFIFDNLKIKDKVIEIIQFYTKKYKTWTSEQLNLRTTILKYYGGETMSCDIIIEKQESNFVLMSPNNSEGNINELKKDLINFGLKIVKIVNESRIYFKKESRFDKISII